MSSEEIDIVTKDKRFLIGQRIRQFRDQSGLTVKQLSELTGIGRSTLSEVESQKHDITSEKIEKLLRHTDINPLWLLTGKGPMLRNPEPEQNDQCLHEDPKVTVLLIEAKKVLTSGNTAAAEALEKNIHYFAHAVDVEQRLSNLEAEFAELKRTNQRLVTQLNLGEPEPGQAGSSASTDGKPM